MTAAPKAVDVVAAMDRFMPGPYSTESELLEARAAIAELMARAERMAETLEMPTLVKQSSKNENAGFIDWRDWCALKGEVAALRAVVARCGGAQ